MDNISRQNIIEIITDIQNSTIEDINIKDIFYSKKYAEFKKANPIIFQTTINGKMDPNMLGFMMSMLVKMENQDLNQEEASKNVGTMLFNKYVKPEVSNMQKVTTQNNEPQINIINGGENISLSLK